MNRLKENKLLVASLVVISTLTIFILNIIVPLGFIFWVFFIIPILLVYWAYPMKYLIPFTVFVAVLIILNFFINYYTVNTKIPYYFAVFNRTTGIGLFFLIAVLLRYQRKARLKLKEEREYFRVIFSNNSAAIAIIEADTTISMVNDAYCQLSGYKKEEVEGMSWTLQIPPEDLERLKEYNRIRLTSPKDAPDKYEFKYYNKAGEVRCGLMSVSMLQSNRKIITSFIDITERKKSEEALIESEEKFSKAFQNSPDVFIITSIDDGIIIDVNESILRIGGYTREELLGKSSIEFNLWESIEARNEFVEMLNQHSRVLDYESKFRRKSGELFTGLISGEIIHLKEKKCVLSIIHDISERKRTEESIRQFENIVSSSIDMLAIIDNNYTYQASNDTYAGAFGLTKETLKGQTIEAIFGTEFFNSVIKPQVDRCLKNEIINYQEWFNFKDAEPKYMDIFYYPFLDKAGVVKGFVVNGRDITLTKQLTDMLHRERQEYQSIIDVAPVMIAYKSADDHFIRLNNAFAEFIGLPREQIIGKTTFDVVLEPDVARKGREHDLEVIRTGIPSINNLIKWSSPWGNKDKWSLFSKYPFRDEAGKIIGTVSYVVDITELKHAEEALSKSEEEFRLLAESMPQIVWITRSDGWNIYFNQQWVDYTGLTLEESYGHGWNKPFHPDDKQRAWDAWHNAVTNNARYSLECRLRRNDGVYRWWLIRGVPILDANGNILKWFGTCTDIEDIKQKEAEIKEQLDELRRWQEVTLEREERIMELKKEVNKILVESGKAIIYESVVE